MTYPVLDPQQGLQFTASGKDIALLWPEDGAAYAVAGLRVAFTQFHGRWRYNQDAGIKYLEEILGYAPPERVLQLLFRRVALKYLPDPQVSVRYDGSDIRVTVTDTAAQVNAEIGLLDEPITPTITIEAAELQTAAIRIRFTSELRKLAVPPVSTFEILGSAETVTAVQVLGRELLLTLSGEPTGGVYLRISYDASATPLLQGVNRAYVQPFVFFLSTGYILTDAEGYILTQADHVLTLEEGSQL